MSQFTHPLIALLTALCLLTACTSSDGTAPSDGSNVGAHDASNGGGGDATGTGGADATQQDATAPGGDTTTSPGADTTTGPGPDTTTGPGPDTTTSPGADTTGGPDSTPDADSTNGPSPDATSPTEDAVDPPGPDDGCPDEHFLDLTHGWVGAGAGYPALTLSVTCDLSAGTMTVTSNGIPHYTYVSMTPNPLAAANHSWTVPLNPTVADAPSDIPLLGDAGFGVNGSVWYGPNEGPFPDPYGDPIGNAICDWCGGHTADAYHFHALDETMLVDLDGDGEPTCMDTVDVDQSGDAYVPGAQPSPIVGYALDGFPIYGSYGCTESACTEVIEFKSAWENTGYLTNTVGCANTSECGNPTGVCDGPQSGNFDPYQCYSCNKASIDGVITTACLPTTEAWNHHNYIAKSGDEWLDECNGRFGPDGTYRYHATSTFPYILGCYMGTPSAGGGGGDAGGDQPGGPASCTTDADCLDACPDTSLGCTCHQSPMGLICVPTCTTDDDCPDAALVCHVDAGICVPAGGPPGG